MVLVKSVAFAVGTLYFIFPFKELHYIRMTTIFLFVFPNLLQHLTRCSQPTYTTLDHHTDEGTVCFVEYNATN